MSGRAPEVDVATPDLPGAPARDGAAPAPLAAPAPHADRSPRAEESLVIQTSFLGDVVLTTPLIAELAMRGPVDVVVTPAAAPLLADHPGIRRLVVYDKRGEQGGLAGLWRLAAALRGNRRLDRATRVAAPTRRAKRTAYLAQGSIRSAMLALLAGCRERVGFDSSAGRRMYTRVVPRRDDRHHAERLWRLAFPGNAGVEPPRGAIRPRLYPGAAERAAVDALLAGVDAPFVALAPGSAWGTKRWPHYPALARALAREHPLVLVGGHGDSGEARAISDAVPGARIVDATGRLSPLASAELIRRAAVLVTNDSLPQHLASAMDTPTVTLFGPTVPSFGFGPLAPGSATAGLSELACRPCHHHGPARCPLGHWRCMRELDASTVVRLVTSILAAA